MELDVGEEQYVLFPIYSILKPQNKSPFDYKLSLYYFKKAIDYR